MGKKGGKKKEAKAGPGSGFRAVSHDFAIWLYGMFLYQSRLLFRDEAEQVEEIPPDLQAWV